MQGDQSKPLMIGWYDRDIEFEEYVTKSLEDKHAQWKREDKIARQNLEKTFEEVAAEQQISSEAVASDIEAMPVRETAVLSDGTPVEAVAYEEEVKPEEVSEATSFEPAYEPELGDVVPEALNVML